MPVSYLTECDFSEVINLLPGSYLITVTPVTQDSPTATFSISKSNVYTMGFPVRITGTPGLITGEQLELRWLPGLNIELRKTGPGYDGEYLVDINVNNNLDKLKPPKGG
jgi:hypothetical protein